MVILIWIVAFILVLSKFLDCYSTARKIKHPAQEQNRLARKWMHKIGTQTTIWLTFVLVLLIVFLSLLLVFSFYHSTFYRLCYVLTGLLISVIQFAVAHTNYTGKLNFFTRIILRKFR